MKKILRMGLKNRYKIARIFRNPGSPVVRTQSFHCPGLGSDLQARAKILKVMGMAFPSPKKEYDPNFEKKMYVECSRSMQIFLKEKIGRKYTELLKTCLIDIV